MADSGQGAILSLGIELAGRQGWITDLRQAASEYERFADRINRVQLATSIGGGQKFLPGTGYIGGGVGGFQPLLTGPGMGYAPSYKGGGIQPYRPSPNFAFGRGAGEPGGPAMDIPFTAGSRGGNVPLLGFSGRARDPITGRFVSSGAGGIGGGGRTVAGRAEVGDDDESIKKSTKSLKEHNDELKKGDINYAKLVARAVAVIPIWMSLRAAFQAVTTSIVEGFKYWEDLDTAMAKMGAVTQGVDNLPEFMSQLRNEVKQLSIDTGKSVNDVADTYYRFAETGMKGADAVAGMNTALKLSIATFADTGETARILVDLYNNLGNTIPEATTAQEKFNYIGGIFTTLWKENAGNLNEYIQTLKTFTGVASGWGLNLKQTLTLTTVLSNAMQRAGTAGTQLSRAFQELTKNRSAVESFLGRNLRTGGQKDYFTELVEVMTKLKAQKDAGKDISQDVMSIFGERTQKGVLGLVGELDKFLEVWEKIKNLSVEDAIKVMNTEFERQMNTVAKQLERFKQLKNQASETFITAITKSEDFVEALKKINSYIETDLIPTMLYLGLLFNKIFNPKSWVNFSYAIKKPFGKIEGIEANNPLMLQVQEAYMKGTKAPSLKGVYGASYLSWEKQFLKQDAFSKNKMLQGLGMDEGKAVELAANISTPTEGTLLLLAKRQERSQLKTKDTFQTDFAKQQAKYDYDTISIGGNISKRYEYQLEMLNRLKASGYTDIEIQQKKLILMNEQNSTAEEIYKERIKLINMENDAVIKLSDTLKSSMEGAFEGLLKGESSISGVFSKIGDTYRDQMFKSVSGGLTENIFKNTGIGEMFGVSMSNLRNIMGGNNSPAGSITGAFEDGSKMSYDAIVRGFAVGTGGTVVGGQVIGASGSAGWSGSGGNIFGGNNGWTLPGYGKTGWFNQPIGGRLTGVAGANRDITNMENFVGGKSGTYRQASRGQLAGAAVGGMMTGYSQYQSAQAGGISQGQAAASGVMTGVGSALLTVAMINAWNPVGWVIAGALLVGGILTGTLGGKKSKQESVTEQSTENKVASKIDVTNQHLQVINRNLVAMRQDLTYIMPRSTYFSERRSIDDVFSISSQRGLQ